MRRLGGGLLVAVLIVLGVWIAALKFLPDAAPTRDRPAPQAAAEDAAADAPESPLALPVAGIARAAIADSWGDPRENGLREHHGTDILAPAGTPVIAAAPGTVEKLWSSAAGGTTVYVRSPQKRWTYYYAHLSGYAPGLHEGQAVRTGDPIGFVGDTGNAGAGNYHLHFGLTRTMPEQHWYEGRDVDPYPYLAGKPAGR